MRIACWFCIGVSCLMLAGCVTPQLTPEDLTVVRQSGVSAATMQKLARGYALDVEDLAELGRKKVPDDIILRHVTAARTVYQLTTREIDRLRQAGLSDRVVDFLLSTPQRFAIEPIMENGVWQDSWYGDSFYYREGYPWHRRCP